MTIDLIRQARERLEQLRAESTQGVWESLGGTIETNQDHWEVLSSEVDCMSYCYGGSSKGLKSEDAELIVTLHRTLDAQIALLAQAELYLGMKIIPADENNVRNEIALAKAIMGVE